MRRRITMLIVAAMLALSMTFGGVAFAKVGCTETFEKGQTTETGVKGSHGTTDSHQGAPHSSGKDRGGGPCKATGSDQTNTC